MKILYITDSFPPESVGGAGQVVLDLANGVRERGHRVAVLTMTQDKARVGTDVFKGIPVTRLYFWYPTKFLRSYFSMYNPFLRGSIRRVLAREQPDIVHFHNIHEFVSFAALKWAKRSGARVFFTAHDVMSFGYTRLYHFIDPEDPTCRKDYDYRLSWQFLLKENRQAFNPIRNVVIRRYLNYYTDGIFAVSDALKTAMVQNGIRHVGTLYNGVREEDFSAEPDQVLAFRKKFDLVDKRIVLFGGRGMADKGPETLLSAFVRLAPIFPDVVLVMAVELGAYQEHLKRLAAGTAFGDRVCFTGLVHGSDLACLFRASEVVAVPSLYFDPAPLMVMQAMAAGVPVVGTCFGGTPEIVQDGITGYIVNPYRIYDLSAKIGDLLSNPDRAHEFGRHGFERFRERFTVPEFISRTLNAYHGF